MLRADGCPRHDADVRAEQRAGVASWHLDLTSGAFATSPAARALFGWPADGPSPSLAQYLACVHPDDADRVAAAADGLVRRGTEYSLEHRALFPGGRLAYLRAVATAHRDDSGRTLCVHGLCVDVTDLLHAAGEADQARAQARAVLDTLPDGYLLASAGVVLEVNAALCRITGFPAAELEGARTPYPFWDPARLAETLAVRDRLAQAGGGTAEIDAVHKDGSPLRLEMTATAVPGGQGMPVWAVLLRDVTDERRWQRTLEQQALTDELTGLPNSRTFRQRLSAAVAASSHGPLSLAVLDLDRFKAVNDRHGHAVGDEVLVEAAHRMRAVLSDDVLLARIGGEEFAVLLPGRTAHEAREVVLRVLDGLRREPFGPVGTVTASAGVGQLLDGMDDDGLFRLADHYLYEAKDRGRDQVR